MATRTQTRTTTRTRARPASPTTSTAPADTEEPEAGPRYRLDFGTHRGRTLDEVPRSYIQWLSANPEVYKKRADLKRALEEAGHLNAATRAGAANGSTRPAKKQKRISSGGGTDGPAGKKEFSAFAGGGNRLGG